MQRRGGAAIPMSQNKICLLAGAKELKKHMWEPYAEEILQFLDALARNMRKCKDASSYPELVSFAFFIRRGNLEKKKEQYNKLLELQQIKRAGRGLLFHVAPSNVPVNFAYSYVFGLLSGNSNIVRVSSKSFPQVDLLCQQLNETLSDPAWEKIRRSTQIISYERDQEINDELSKNCDGRVIWGGDDTIRIFRKSGISPRCIEVVFADRYSLGLLSMKSVLEMPETEVHKLAHNFYNDTYLMDQNACSTPHLLIWVKDVSEERMEDAKQRFWNAVFFQARFYDLADQKVSEKFAMLCQYAAALDDIGEIKRYENLLYIIRLKQIQEIEQLRGKFGLFFEYECGAFADIQDKITARVQTLAVEGMDREALQRSLVTEETQGIDRIVPFGKTLDIGPLWDGYDIVSALSRAITLL